jgi:hypothetical protein
MRRTLLAAAASLLAGILLPGSALAQGESAEPLRAHALRLTIGSDWSHWTERFGTPSPLNPGLIDGAREPIGAYFGADSLGTQQLGFLAPTEAQVRSMTGLNGWLLNVGRAKLTLDASVRTTPIHVEYALSSRLGFSVNVPIVRARMSAFLTGPDSTAASKGNVGLNTAFVTPGNLDAFRNQADTALRALRAQMTSGPVGLRAQAQSLYNSLQPLACGLYSLGAGSSSDVNSPCHSATPIPQSIVMPIDTSAVGDTLTVFLSRGESSYATLAAQYAVAGVTMPAFTSAYALPGAALDSSGIRRLFFDQNGPLAGESLNEVVRTSLGDVEVGAWFQIANGAHLRSQVALTARLATGTTDSKDNFIDLATGTGERGIEVGLKNDLIAGKNLWFHVGARYGMLTADQLLRRVSPWYMPFAPLSSTALVQRKLGDYINIDLVPNWQLDDAFGVGIGWHYFHQAATTYSYVDPTDQARIGLPADVLGQATEVTRMRVGAGVTFSTLARYARGRARLPYRVTWSYNATLYGRGGQVPKDGVMQVMIQAYIGGVR